MTRHARKMCVVSGVVGAASAAICRGTDVDDAVFGSPKDAGACSVASTVVWRVRRLLLVACVHRRRAGRWRVARVLRERRVRGGERARRFVVSLIYRISRGVCDVKG